MASAANFKILSATSQGVITWTNANANGICTIESLPKLALGASNIWQIGSNYFTSNSVGQAVLPLNATNRYFRVVSADISGNNALGYSNLLQSYGRIQTIAGTGYGGTDGVNYWKTSFEGGYATNAALSRPHNAVGDTNGNVFIVDKDSHSVLKVTPDGKIYTIAGTHSGGYNGDGPAQAKTLQLYQPNGLFIKNSILYVMDTGNAKIRRIDTNGVMTTMFTVSSGISKGRGLWVNDTETMVVFGDGIYLKSWDPTNKVVTLNSSFNELGNIFGTDSENIIASDRGANQVWKVDIHGKNAGTRTLKYGSGKSLAFVDGASAVTNSLYGVRGVFKFPTDQGYLLALHEGSQIIYVDSNDIGHIFVNGMVGAHSGDGQWFHSAGYKISEARSVTMDPQGNILIVENDYGYVRRIEFKRLNP